MMTSSKKITIEDIEAAFNKMQECIIPIDEYYCVCWTEEQKKYLEKIYPLTRIVVLPQQFKYPGDTNETIYILPEPNIYKPIKVVFENE